MVSVGENDISMKISSMEHLLLYSCVCFCPSSIFGTRLSFTFEFEVSAHSKVFIAPSSKGIGDGEPEPAAERIASFHRYDDGVHRIASFHRYDDDVHRTASFHRYDDGVHRIASFHRYDDEFTG
ncbi:hypothetical protein PoB_002653200 [Plakobranchus ocellatus]|uniref:Uncharacterized protein n=1 Tax=Plakobranchus ocellatus TaxID=259542 RepID=A0AAV3ZZM3_9GAST|nr:hypothetical protein PoB_002653200 [Plakobranchus ocellatus]